MGVEIRALPAPPGRTAHGAFLGEREVATFDAKPGGRGCGGVRATRATLAGRTIVAGNVPEWVAALDRLPALAFLPDACASAAWNEPSAPPVRSPITWVWDPPKTARYVERVRASARVSVELAEERIAYDRADAERGVRQLHDHPSAVALRTAHGDADERVPLAEGPPDDPALTLALRVSRSRSRTVVRERLRHLRVVVGDLSPVDLVTALIYHEEGVPLTWTQTTLPM